MDANDVIDSYVHDVARRLPSRHRDDVAFELRVLLGEDLRTRASAEGREPDADLALRLVRSLGRPSETAARYHPPFTLVHPNDTWSFVAGAVGGAAALSILTAPRHGESFAAAAQRTNVAVLAWLGLLVLLFAAKSLILSRRPQAFAWKPRRGRRVPSQADRLTSAGSALLWAAFLALYLAPGRIVEALTLGRVDSRTLTYSGSFRGGLRMPWLAALILAIIVLHILVAVQGRWRDATRWARIFLHMSAAIQLGWHARYGTIFQHPHTDRVLIPAVAALAGILMAVAWIELYREVTRVRPAPHTGLTT
jgi:hypothetical protein